MKVEWLEIGDNLIVDPETGIVYATYGLGVCPLFSCNGNLQRYVDGEIVEI